MGSWSITHWLIVLVIVVVIFGTGRLKSAGKDIGDAVREFKKGVRGDDEAQRLRDERRDADADLRGRDTSDVDRDRR
ncbi:Sec-independent protein translocase subunit TatA [Cognatilysobacter segetis]|uniref:Sec-independent protein translocase subunit TatA n=1 Tax=Cognatilysobacter segetis TaxID=2492394 RepID=UPI001060B8A5|nr:Sec-independent protein translocase subunit TatA [Lysobacter segetis]